MINLKSTNGILKFDDKEDIWYFYENSGLMRKITIIPWLDTAKGPLTEILIETRKRKIIIEFIGKEDEDFYDPNFADRVKGICEELLLIDMKCHRFQMGSSLEKSIRSIIEVEIYKAAHIYYGTGLYFGLVKNIFGIIYKKYTIPCRALRYPGTRKDSEILW